MLAEMYRDAGGRPTTVVNLSSGLDKYDVVVWAPDDFSMPTGEVREFLETWLAGASGRTLVYIGRDYDAACDYWQTMVPQAPAEQRLEVMRRAAEARSAHSHARVAMPAEECCDWFVMRRDFPGRRVEPLDGLWSRRVDAAQAQIWSQGRLEIPTDNELAALRESERPLDYGEPLYAPLLTSGKETLVFEVSRSAWGTSRILVVANGSFLLNLPLVNRQHRRLAGRLIDACQPFGAVAFLESSVGGPFVWGQVKNVDEDVLRARVLLGAHWLLLGVVFCFLAFPIFGRPRSIEASTVADFGHHVDAMASLLERTGDTEYARQQLDLYRKGQGHENPHSSSTAEPVLSVGATTGNEPSG